MPICARAFYVVDMDPDVLVLRTFGGLHYMDTPVLGEIDYVRKPNGCYKVDIFDMVIVARAYGSQGLSVPDAHWFPGADVSESADSAGKIDIYDVTTVASHYGTEWDNPPP